MADEGDENIGAAFLGTSESKNGAVMDVKVEVIAVLGIAEMKIEQILQLGRGAVVELNRRIDEPVDLRAAGQVVARGEVVVVADNLAIQLSEIVKRR